VDDETATKQRVVGTRLGDLRAGLELKYDLEVILEKPHHFMGEAIAEAAETGAVVGEELRRMRRVKVHRDAAEHAAFFPAARTARNTGREGDDGNVVNAAGVDSDTAEGVVDFLDQQLEWNLDLLLAEASHSKPLTRVEYIVIQVPCIGAERNAHECARDSWHVSDVDAGGPAEDADISHGTEHAREVWLCDEDVERHLGERLKELSMRYKQLSLQITEMREFWDKEVAGVSEHDDVDGNGLVVQGKQHFEMLSKGANGDASGKAYCELHGKVRFKSDMLYRNFAWNCKPGRECNVRYIHGGGRSKRMI